MTVITTASGQRLNLALPAASSIRIRDIAHQLACINRFHGAPALPYSVAQHSTVVAKIAEQVSDDPLLALQALIHDAHEAFTGDIVTPLQETFADGGEQLRRVQRTLDLVIHDCLGVPLPAEEERKTIGFADRRAFATEWRDLMPGQCPVDHGSPANFAVKPIPWHKAEEKFLKEFERLSMLAGVHPPRIPNLLTGINK